MQIAATESSTRRNGSVDRVQREKELIAAAQQAFVSHGYHGASMDLVAGLAGISKPIIYQFFAGKLELYQATVELRSAELLNRMKTVAENATDSEHLITDSVKEFLAYVEEEEEAFLLLADSTDRNGPQLTTDNGHLALAFSDFLAPMISQRAHRSEEEGLLISRAVVSMCVSVALEWVKYGKATPREHLAEDLADVAWNGLRRRMEPEHA